MKVVDDAVLAITGFKRMVNGVLVQETGTANLGFDVWDGESNVRRLPGSLENPLPIVIELDTPFAVYGSSLGLDSNRRLSGEHARRSTMFTFMYIGDTREQAKACGQDLRDLFQDQRLDLQGHRSWLVTLQESQRIWRDNEAVRRNGDPLFYGVDIYAVGATLTRRRGAA